MWHINSLAVGASTTLVYDVTVEDSRDALLDAEQRGGGDLDEPQRVGRAEERTGSGTPAWNDYRTSDTLSIPVDTVASITKDLLPPADGYWTIGSDVYYQIRVMLPRTTISDLTVTDVIGDGGYRQQRPEIRRRDLCGPGRREHLAHVDHHLLAQRRDGPGDRDLGRLPTSPGMTRRQRQPAGTCGSWCTRW